MNREEEQALRQITEDMREFSQKTSLPDRMERLEKNEIRNALHDVDGNQTLAAKRLGIGRTCLIAKMKKLGLL